MSDGPHRSLKLRPHWRVCLERAANSTHTDVDVASTLTVCVAREIPVTLIRQVQKIMDHDTLFPELRREQLDALRNEHAGSPSACAMIDGGIEALHDRYDGDEGLARAVECSVGETLDANTRAMVEHAHHAGQPEYGRFAERRLFDAQRALGRREIAEGIIARANRRGQLPTPPRHTGLDDGPQL